MSYPVSLAESAKGALALQRQLARYAEDFEELMGRHGALERRHENLKASYARLTEAGEVLGRLNRSSDALCLVIDQEGHIKGASDGARAKFRLDSGKVSRIQQLVAPFHLPHLEIMLTGIVDGSNDLFSEQTELMLHTGGESSSFKPIAASFLAIPDGENTHVCWVMRDLHADMDTERLSFLHRGVHQGSMVLDSQGKVLSVDHTFTTVTGYANQDIQGQTPGMLSGRHGGPLFQDALWAELAISGRWRGEITNLAKDERPLRQWLSVTAVKDSESRTSVYVLIFADRELMLSAERAVLDSAGQDALTGLPNFSLFQDRASQKINAACRNNSRVAVLSIGLDRLQWMKDTEERGISETIIQTAGTRLQELIRGCDLVARSGPDNFVVLLVGLQHESEIAGIANKMVEALSLPIIVREQSMVIGGSVGCALFPQDGTDASKLLKHAAIAMQLAQTDGGNGCRMFSQKMSGQFGGSPHSLEQDFRQALEKDEIYLTYQAHVASDGLAQLLACEAQLRWRHAVRGDVSWQDCSGQAAKDAPGVEPGIWMLKAACQQLRDWQLIGLDGLNMVVNLTVAQISSDLLAAELAGILKATGIDPCRLELALTGVEDLTIQERELAHLLRLRKLGVKIALRDFSVWSSSLAQIKLRPFDRLRIEYGFLEDASSEKSNSATQEWMTGMGVTVRLDLISDYGRQAPRQELRSERQAHLSEGYLKAIPMTPAQFSKWAYDNNHMRHDPQIAGRGA